MAEVKFTDQNFEKEVLESKDLVLVDFWAEWCGPCQMMAPVIEELAGDNSNRAVKIGKLNVDENPQTAEKYKIMSIPSLLFFKDGEVVDQIMGAQAKEEVQKKIDELL